jgi:hypothetical protein
MRAKALGQDDIGERYSSCITPFTYYPTAAFAEIFRLANRSLKMTWALFVVVFTFYTLLGCVFYDFIRVVNSVWRAGVGVEKI